MRSLRAEGIADKAWRSGGQQLSTNETAVCEQFNDEERSMETPSSCSGAAL
jgi:hypothetical protein